MLKTKTEQEKKEGTWLRPLYPQFFFSRLHSSHSFSASKIYSSLITILLPEKQEGLSTGIFTGLQQFPALLFIY
jgi:hypothetical protein